MMDTAGYKISPKKQERIDFDSEAALKIIAKERKAMRIRKWIVGTAAVLLPMLIMSAGVYRGDPENCLLMMHSHYATDGPYRAKHRRSRY